jgi:acyl-CoA reductase-like NAD-dependent aldehyde dehydrogenase
MTSSQRPSGDLFVGTGPEASVLSPADGSLVGAVPTGTLDDVAEVIRRGRSALADWSRTSPHDRWQCLRAGAQRLAAAAPELGFLHARESGKVLAQAVREVHGAAGLVEANAHLGRFATGTVAPTGALAGGEADLTWVERVPLGLVVCVIPFNFPVELTVEKAAAALAAGNVVVVKPPPQNPLATIEACRILVSAGLPAGVLQVLTGDTAVSAALCAADGVDAVSLTGSVGAGVAVASATATLLRPLHLELGGNGAAVVLGDADLEYVTAEVLRGRMLMNGQACAATKRVVVEASVAAELTERLAVALGDVVVGDPTDPASAVGPLIDAPSAARVAAQVRAAVDDGASRALGRPEAEGAWFHPTLLAAVPTDAGVAVDDEIFGPVVSVVPVGDADAAVGVVNASSMGLTAAVFSADLPRAVAVAQRLEVGGVVINGPNNYRPPVVPVGGVGMAGSGREGIGYTIEEMTRTRFIAVRGLRPPAPAPQPPADPGPSMLGDAGDA